MPSAKITIPPHELWLTAVEEDNDVLDMTAENKGEDEAEVEFSVEAGDGILARCKNERDSTFEENPTYTATIDPSRVERVEFSFIYRGDSAKDDTIVAQIMDGQSTVRREIPVVLAEN